MEVKEFISKYVKFFDKVIEQYSVSIGTDFSKNYRVLIDKEGFIWIRAFKSWKRVKTSVNINNVVEFRRGVEKDEGFYIICSDDTGLEVKINAFDGDLDIWYCIDGKRNDIGTAFAYFNKFPVK